MSMNLPKLTGILDLQQMQLAVAMFLLDEPRLASVPIVPQIMFLMDSKLALDTIWTTPRSRYAIDSTGMHITSASPDSTPASPVGAGILIEEIEADTESANVTGGPSVWTMNAACFEERNVNLTPSVGTMLQCEQSAQIIKDAMHLQPMFPYGTWRVARKWMQPAHDWMALFPEIKVQRVTLQAVTGVPQTNRTAFVTAAFAANVCTLSCSDPSANIFWTNDGTIPVSTNPNAKNYTSGSQSGPFPVVSGDVILVCGRSPNLLPSAITPFTAP